MKHPALKVRLFVGLIMLLLAFIGVIINNENKQLGWNYWRWMAVIYALLSLGLSWHLKKVGWKKELTTISQEMLHWAGLIVFIGLVSFVVHIGFQDRFTAGIEVLFLLGLTTYLAGIYTEVSFIPIGLLLGLFAASLAFFSQYLYVILIPLTILGILILLWEAKRTHRA